MITWKALNGAGECSCHGENSSVSSRAKREAKEHYDEDSLALTWPPG